VVVESITFRLQRISVPICFLL